jgi:hypothetical protein
VENGSPHTDYASVEELVDRLESRKQIGQRTPLKAGELLPKCRPVFRNAIELSSPQLVKWPFTLIEIIAIDNQMLRRPHGRVWTSTQAPAQIASQYATISQPEEMRPSRRMLGSVSLNASSAGEWQSLKTSTVVARNPVSNATGIMRHNGKRDEAIQ